MTAQFQLQFLAPLPLPVYVLRRLRLPSVSSFLSTINLTIRAKKSNISAKFMSHSFLLVSTILEMVFVVLDVFSADFFLLGSTTLELVFVVFEVILTN